MGTETSKIALNPHVHLRTANQQMSRPERHVDDITDMRRSCRLRENTSGRRPLGSSSRLLKVPNIGALGAIKKGLETYLGRIPGQLSISELQKITLLGTAHILRRVLSS